MSVNKQLPEELHKRVIKKFKRRKVYARFKDNIWAPDLAEMGALSSKYKNDKYLLRVIDLSTKYAWVKPSKGKITVLNAFIEIVNETNLNQINYRLIKEENFTINLCNNGKTIMIFQFTPHIMKVSQ